MRTYTHRGREDIAQAYHLIGPLADHGAQIVHRIEQHHELRLVLERLHVVILVPHRLLHLREKLGQYPLAQNKCICVFAIRLERESDTIEQDGIFLIYNHRR